jgi:oligosaccharyltransferase complex subunit epsilon
MYALTLLLAALAQVVYVFLVGTFPMNSFLAGFMSCMGGFVLAFSFRLQVVAPQEFGGISAQRAFAEFIVANLILSLAVLNYMG